MWGGEAGRVDSGWGEEVMMGVGSMVWGGESMAGETGTGSGSSGGGDGLDMTGERGGEGGIG